MNQAQMLRFKNQYNAILNRITDTNEGGLYRLDLDYPLETVLVTAFRSEGFSVEVIGNMKTIITW